MITIYFKGIRSETGIIRYYQLLLGIILVLVGLLHKQQTLSSHKHFHIPANRGYINKTKSQVA